MIQIRKATQSDHSKIVEFQITMAWETEELKLDFQTVTAGVQSVISDPTKGAYWIAEKAGEMIGALLTVPEWSDWRNGTVLWIHSLYVIPAERRRGVFRALYNHLQGLVEKDGGLKGIRLYVEQNNQVAQEVYEALGMTKDHYYLYEWLK
jgi:ribosomal protein S18 acetylase RimI-like enzyme